MQHSTMFVLCLAAMALCAEGLVVAGSTKDASKLAPMAKPHLTLSQTKASVPHTALAQQIGESLQFTDVDPTVVRPHASKGAEPEQVKYGLRIINFFGTALKKHTFAVDMVMSCQWNDPRAVDLIPEGLDQLSMAWNQAVKLLWMPGIVVTNRDIEKYEIVSASVTIFRSGEVLRVERAQARIMMKFQLQSYPFDTQNLAIQIASSKYMLDELQLVADKNASGVIENIWGLYDLLGWKVDTYETADGVLMKSRGSLVLELKRGNTKYYEDHLVPSFIALTISWAVFYFPFAGPFITPRLALSILALLTFTNLMVKSSKELPGAAPFNWNDLFNQQIQTLMFITIVLNISSEICFHQFQMPDLARNMNHEAKILMPVMSILNVVIILSSGTYRYLSLTVATRLTKTVVLILVLIYAGIVSHRVYNEKKAPPATSEAGTTLPAASNTKK